jgi:hypothetical protein
MCRIAYIPDPKELGSDNMTDLFAYLEETQGGDGNGLAFKDSDGIIHAVKGVSMPTEFLAQVASKLDGPVLFHTRNATIGGTCNELCQPFVIDNIAFVHNGHWHGWGDVAMELLVNGDMDGHGPINDSLAAAALAIKHGRYSLEAIRTGVFVIMTPNEAWLHLRGGMFRFCESMGIYASDFPKDWPTSKSISDDAVARLLPDGPEFECGSYWKKPHTVVHYFGSRVQQKAADEDDSEKGIIPGREADEEALAGWEEDEQEVATALEDLTNHELRQQMDHPSLRKFGYGELAQEWQRRREDEEIAEDWRREYGL